MSRALEWFTAGQAGACPALWALRDTLDAVLARAQDMLDDFDAEELTLTKTDGQVLIGGRLVKAYYQAKLVARPLVIRKLQGS